MDSSYNHPCTDTHTMLWQIIWYLTCLSRRVAIHLRVRYPLTLFMFVYPPHKYSINFLSIFQNKQFFALSINHLPCSCHWFHLFWLFILAPPSTSTISTISFFFFFLRIKRELSTIAMTFPYHLHYELYKPRNYHVLFLPWWLAEGSHK